MEVKHFLDGLIYLDTINLEEKILKSPSVSLTKDNLFFDLSKCQFAELGALAQLILIIESYLKFKHIVFIALPTVNFTTSQRKSQKDSIYAENALAKQKNVNNFIKKTGFINALQDLAKRYKTEIYFTDEYDYVKKGKGIKKETFLDTFSVLYEKVIINESNYKFLLPFKIVDTKDDIQKITFDFEHQLDKILQNEERGIYNFDIRIIKNVILPELIKNVKYHSGESHAIFTIGLLNSKSIFFADDYDNYLLKPGAKRKINPIELTHIQRIKENNIESQVEIYFGDCGIGLLNKDFKRSIKKDFGNNITDNRKFLKLAFNRWSTTQDNKERRGTKGLYRLKRIVDKYKGMVHIKTSKSNGGFFNGEFEFRNVDTNFNGTLISVKTNAFKEIKSFKISTDRKISNIGWTSEKVMIDKDLNCLDTIRQKILIEKNLLLIVDITNFNLAKDYAIFESFLYHISEISHPSAIVIYLINNNEKLDDDSISTFVESVEERIRAVRKEIKEKNKDSSAPDSEDSKLEEIHDPVLVIVNNNQTFWYGGSEKITTLLNESYTNLLNDKSLKFYELESYGSLEEDEDELKIIESYLETDHNLVTLNNDGDIVFNFYGIEKHYEDKIKNFKPEITDKLICTPKLNIVKSWIDIKQLLQDDEYGFALCLYLKYRRFYENKNNTNISRISKTKTFILIDSNQQLELTKKFVELIGLKNKNIRNIEEEIDYSMPKRTKLFNDNSDVIVLTTIVSSSETLRRMVKYAKRDNANPEIILCLINSRISKITKLETWNEVTGIISIYQKNKIDAQTKDRNDEYLRNKLNDLSLAELKISPKYEEEIDDNKLIEVNKNLLAYLKDNKVLHYNHYGHYNKRHFTFYLDKNSIINSIPANDFLSKEFIGAIREWKEKNNISEFTLYFNKRIINKPLMLQDYLENNELNNFKFVDINEYTAFDRNSIYFDFGILTGESINKLINKIDMVDNFLACLLFNQSINSNAEIYERIKTLKFKRNTLLFEREKEEHIVNFQIKYLFNLPLSFFNSENCPICEHRRALDYYKIEDPYLKEFGNDRRERLKEISADEINELSYPVDFYYSDKENEKRQELSNNIIFQMYELKILLENASLYTKQRIKLYKYIHNLYENIDIEILNPESKLYSLVYYLSHEINWLQREPLIFRDFRVLLSKIGYTIATRDISSLVTNFNTANKYDIPSKNLATRYKYSAISLLRSSDKLLFCQSIFDIIKSSIFNNKLSNNLFQNTIYHISSFFKNSYNKSEIYFFYISNNLEKILQEIEINTPKQKDTIHNIINENKKSRLKTYAVQKEPNDFRIWKNNWMNIYYYTPGHPIVYEYFRELYISKVKNLFDNKDFDLDSFKTTIKDNWINLKSYLMNLFIEVFENQLDLLKESSYFQEKFANSLETSNIWRNKIKEIDYIIEGFINNPETYSKNEKTYNDLLDKIKEGFIQKEGLSIFKENAKLIHLLNEFPTNITENAEKVFNDIPNKTFYYIKNNRDNTKLPINLNEEFWIYYPKPLFVKYLELVKQNIKKRLNQDCALDKVQLRIEIDTSVKEYLGIYIIYDCTNNYKGEIKENGSLNGWEKSIQEFGGSLEYQTPTPDCVDFKLKLKFLRYGF